MSKINKSEPMPTQSDRSVPVGERLKKMIDERTALGIRKYGTPLMSFNGRDCLMDALQESVDLNQYMCQTIIEIEKVRSEALFVLSQMLNMLPRNKYWLDPTIERMAKDLVDANFVEIK